MTRRAISSAGVMAVVACLALFSVAAEKADVAEKPVAASENYTIKVQGGYADCAPLNLTLTGSGPEFRIDLGNPRVSFRARLTPNTDAASIQYELNFQFMVTNGFTRVKTSDTEKSTEPLASVEMRSSGATGSAVLEYGRPLAIVTLNEKRLELTVTRSKGEPQEKK